MESSRVLLVDDHPDSCHIYRAILERRGFSVVTAGDGEEAIRQLHLEPPDILVLDLFLPGDVQGPDVIRELRGRVSTRDIPCVVVTADARDETRRLAYELGCTTYLTKPLDPTTLVRELDDMLEAARSEPLEAHPPPVLP